MEMAAMWLEGSCWTLETWCGRSRSVPARRAQPWHTLPREGRINTGWIEAVRTKTWPCDSPHQSTTDRTYFRHKARGCSGSLSAGPREATSAKGQASSIMKAASSSRMGKSVSVMTAIWGDRLRLFQKHGHQGTSPLESSCGSCQALVLDLPWPEYFHLRNSQVAGAAATPYPGYRGPATPFLLHPSPKVTPAGGRLRTRVGGHSQVVNSAPPQLPHLQAVQAQALYDTRTLLQH